MADKKKEQFKIETRNVELWYDKFQALKDISIGIREHQVTAFIGPSGCGKSTLLRCFNRMNDRIEDCRVGGQFLIDGKDIYDPKKKKSGGPRGPAYSGGGGGESKGGQMSLFPEGEDLVRLSRFRTGRFKVLEV